MNETLADFVRPRARFSRSANIERDQGPDAIDGYVPTGRALDVIARVARGLAEPAAGRAFSITGPHGGGKSSLAVFLDGLLSQPTTLGFKAAHDILRSVDPAVDAELRASIQAVNGSRSGFFRAFATAQKEPVAGTIARALHTAAVRELGPRQKLVPDSFRSDKTPPTNADIRDCIQRIGSTRPMLLLIDEFGKNLEYFVASGSDGDPFLLQQLAEATQGATAIPLVIITLQHSSFDEYVQFTSTARRREWSKVQGRFQDIPYVETASQSRRLIASSLEPLNHQFTKAAKKWVAEHKKELELLGHRELVDDVADALPLHPLALAVLPDLCSRYGQNERTLFSFLTSSEPKAVPKFLQTTSWNPPQPLPLVGLDLLYDYFLESAASMIGVADNASRWVEIETRIRDSAGLTPIQLRVVKTIGVLNLVSSGGRIRASRNIIEFALCASDRHGSSASVVNLDETLCQLVDGGLITYRTFSDEYRIWHGSDYDLRRVIENARQACKDLDLAVLLNESAALDPVVAGRHSQRTGVLRVFAQKFSNLRDVASEQVDPMCDGIVYYSTDPNVQLESVPIAADSRPIVVVVPDDVSSVRDAAIEAAALNLALRTAEEEGVDWVARRELVERTAAAQQSLQVSVGKTWNAHADWWAALSREMLDARRGLSALLSDVSDAAYPATPRVANEMIARRELTSQGAKARRFLIDAMLSRTGTEVFGIQGYGPDRAIYEAVFRATGIHRPDDSGEWSINPPTDRAWKTVWTSMNKLFDSAIDCRISLSDVAHLLTAPPIGLKGGVVPLLLIAGFLARKDEIALYEHGSLVLSMDDAVAERLTKNVGHFSVKNAQTRSGRRRMVIDALVKRLGINGRTPEPTFLNVATALYRQLRILPPYTQKTRRSLSPEAVAVREAFHTAAEPDVLVFETLPRILGFQSTVGRMRLDRAEGDMFAARLAEVILELKGAYQQLLDSIHRDLSQATSTGGTLAEVRKQLGAQAASLAGRVLEPRLRAFVGALTRPLDDDQAWLENVAMVVSDGHAPRVWTDEDAERFSPRMAELGGTFRRTLALLHDRLASRLEEGFFAGRMTLTRPDGNEWIELLALTARQKESIDEHFEPFLARLITLYGSRTAACRMLMARLAAESEEAGSAGSALKIAGEEQRYG